MISEALPCRARRARGGRIAVLLTAAGLIVVGAVMLVTIALQPLRTQGGVRREVRKAVPNATVVTTVDELHDALRAGSRIVVVEQREADLVVWPCFWTSVLTCGMFVLVFSAGCGKDDNE